MKNKNTPDQNYRLAVLIAVLAIMALTACKKFLDAKPDKQLATPTGLADLTAILDADNMITTFPSAGDIASDDYFLPDANWATLSSLPARTDYTWQPDAANDQDWQYGYTGIENANVVLDGLATVPKTAANQADYNNAEGMALFYRGYTLALLANIFTLPYDPLQAGSLPGLPLRSSADITAKTTRSSMAATYGQITADLKMASALLPVQQVSKTRPSKPAAYGALARVYLVTGNYLQAGAYADSCLQLYSTLIDYNTLNTSASAPFQRFNAEVIFHATSAGGAALAVAKARVDTSLYRSYNGNDLRKKLFYKAAAGGYFSFKGSYSGTSSSQLFNGVATNEMLLIRAECNARSGKTAAAAADLNLLLVNRWKTGTYLPVASTLSGDSLLSLVITERRKELAFKGALRWSDLRRYSTDSRLAVTPQRFLNRQQYLLQPGDKRYAFLLPVSVVLRSGIQQNSR
ncbi:MAG: RagB/SusD family nutrient uptake outer membrane protein [Mucilaginibacter sp.]|nr:RagB/SusD family nutrient uptake outer membrane protein [Mucilaginibacter sp.]